MNEFMQALEDAQKLPDLSENDNPIPDLLKGSDLDSLVRKINPGIPGKVAGSTEYSFEYCCARLQIGQKLCGFTDGQAQFEDIDESERLKEIMDMSLSGEAVITKKTETFLKDGSVVLWLEWMEPKTPAAKKTDSVLNLSELLAPEVPKENKDDQYPGEEEEIESEID